MPGSFQYSPPENFRYIYDDGTFVKDPNDFDYDTDDEENYKERKMSDAEDRVDNFIGD